MSAAGVMGWDRTGLAGALGGGVTNGVLDSLVLVGVLLLPLPLLLLVEGVMHALLLAVGGSVPT